MRRLIRLLMVVLCMVLASWTIAGEYLDIPHCVRLPVLDGNISPEEWANATVIPVLQPPSDRNDPGYCGMIVGVPTNILLQWDEKYLYIAFTCYDSDIFTTMKHHDDPVYREDCVEVFIDYFGDNMQYLEIQISPNNVVFDKMFVLTSPPVYSAGHCFTRQFYETNVWEFREWNSASLQTATGRIVENGKTRGWTVEMAIPATLLTKRRGTDKLAPCIMRANFCRYDWQLSGGDGKKREGVFSYWMPVVSGCPHLSPGSMGWLRLRDAERH